MVDKDNWKQFLTKMIVRLTKNRVAQSLLKRFVLNAQFLMGIGSGSCVDSSGESAVLKLLSRRHQPPFCIFDVGSNVGKYVDLITAAFPAGSYSIHCFEPSGAAFEHLSVNVHNRPGITLNNTALGRHKGRASLYFDKPGSVLASFTKRRLEHFNIDMAETEMVEVSTVDDYCRENSIEIIHLLKIDVEGHELDVLAGAGSMFEKGAVDMVTFEFGGCNIDTRTFFQDFFYFFSGNTMKISRITPSGCLVPVDSYHEMHEQFKTTNFVAVKG